MLFNRFDLTKVKYINLDKRFLSMIIDLLIINTIITPISLILYYRYKFEYIDIFFLDIIIIYTIQLYLHIKYSSTIGKMLLDLRIVDSMTGSPITIKQSIIRTSGKILTLIFPFIIIPTLFDDRHRSWYDKISRSVVVENQL